MSLGVCLLFDGRSDPAVRNLWDQLEEKGVSTLRSHTHGQHHPHLSYVVLLEWDLDSVRDAVENVADHDAFEVTFDALGTFRRGRASLIPAVRADLVARQEAVVEAVRATGALVHKHYEIGRWLPHSLLAPRVRTEWLPVLAATAYAILPLTVTVDRAALIDSATGRLWPLRNVP